MSRLGRVDHVQRVFGAAVDLRLLNWGRCTTYTAGGLGYERDKSGTGGLCQLA